LSLKEGFTVFRDQQFSGDMSSRAVKRISDVRALRTRQFAEDAGPLAHPVRPDSYVEINNFYTATVYSKGAEVVRMLHTLLGHASFRKGTDLYFERHDGQAVTTDDFVKAMEDANGVDLTQFRRWYSQAGTPELTVTRHYDPVAKAYTLTVKQFIPPTPGQDHKEPMHIPLAMALLDRKGHHLPLQWEGESAPVGGPTRVLELREEIETFRFVDIPEEPIPSLLRGFSAPLKLKTDLSDRELIFLIGHDDDEFNRWDAGQQLAVKLMLSLIAEYQQGRALSLSRLADTGQGFVDAFKKTLEHREFDPALVAEALTLPSEEYLGEYMKVIDPVAIHEVRDYLRRALATELKERFLAAYEAHTLADPYRYDAPSAGRRRLKNLCLAYLMELDDPEIHRRCLDQLERADNMTDTVSALGLLANTDCLERAPALAAFYEKWKHDALVMDKWFAIQATSRLPNTLSEVKALTQHPSFNLKNPNKVRALVGAFCQANPVCFHEASGAGYEFLADKVLRLNALNPQIAARLLTAMTRWERYDAGRQSLMKAQLERILNTPDLSKDVYEVAAKSLT
jgi:aminopeptidase N